MRAGVSGPGEGASEGGADGGRLVGDVGDAGAGADGADGDGAGEPTVPVQAATTTTAPIARARVLIVGCVTWILGMERSQ
jgi:hypothetical protein